MASVDLTYSSDTTESSHSGTSINHFSSHLKKPTTHSSSPVQIHHHNKSNAINNNNNGNMNISNNNNNDIYDGVSLSTSSSYSSNDDLSQIPVSSSPPSTKFDDLSKHFPCNPLPPQMPSDQGKLTVVLDIDETLVHARLPYDIYRQDEDRMSCNDSDFVGDTFEITLKPGESFIVNKRPGLDEFLREASRRYELIAYTAAVEEYAKPLIDQLDPENRIFRHRLYRSHCIFANGHFVKDLRIVNRPLDRVVLVDNNAYCFLPQLSNGIPISSFYNDHTDTALNVLHKFLHVLQLEKEVQPILKEAFNLEKILNRDRDQLLSGHVLFS